MTQEDLVAALDRAMRGAREALAGWKGPDPECRVSVNADVFPGKPTRGLVRVDVVWECPDGSTSAFNVTRMTASEMPRALHALWRDDFYGRRGDGQCDSEG